MSIGVEPARIRACLLEPVSGHYRLVGWLGQSRQAGLSLADQAADLSRELGRRLRRHLWNDAARTPYLTDEQPLRVPPIEHLAVTLSPLSRLRLGILGLTGQSTQRAREAVASGPVTVVSALHYTPQTYAQALADEWRAARVDVVLLAGGYDAAPAAPHTAIHAMLTHVANALQILPIESRPEIFFAGSAWAGVQVERIFHSLAETELVVLPNLTPAPTEWQPHTVAQALHRLYVVQAQQTPGYGELAAWSNSGIAPATLEANFARLVRAWRELHDLPDLHGLYVMGDCRLHVWATARAQAVRLCYAEMPVASASTAGPGEPYSIELSGWPPLQMLCGGFGRGFQLPAHLRWWDRGAMAPLVTALGATAPLAVRQALQSDILIAPSNPVAARSRALPTPLPSSAQSSKRSSAPSR